jgi:hypothetical protein
MATFGELVTHYDQYLNGTYGYIIRLDTAPNIHKIVSIQSKNLTTISDVTTEAVEITDLMQYPEDIDCPDLGYALESGVVYVFFKTTVYPYTTNTSFLLMAYRFSYELMNFNSELDIPQGDLELFITLSIAIAAELQNKMVPQRVLDKIQYLKDIIALEN